VNSYRCARGEPARRFTRVPACSRRDKIPACRTSTGRVTDAKSIDEVVRAQWHRSVRRAPAQCSAMPWAQSTARAGNQEPNLSHVRAAIGRALPKSSTCIALLWPRSSVAALCKCRVSTCADSIDLAAKPSVRQRAEHRSRHCDAAAFVLTLALGESDETMRAINQAVFCALAHRVRPALCSAMVA
jgi:hypothetical protein